jgi:hypothetical protein
MKTSATRTENGEWAFRGWIIEKMETGQFNFRPENEEFWTDAADTKREAMETINRIEDDK